MHEEANGFYVEAAAFMEEFELSGRAARETDHQDGSGQRCCQVIRTLIDLLHERGVNYCHWKSNIRLDATLQGAEDIDLLVDRRSADEFRSVLAGCGFKVTERQAGSGHPGVFHALAFDFDRAELVDLHGYYQIVSGDSLVKAFRLPVEDLLLEKTKLLRDVRVPAAEVELMLFALRVALKHVHPVEIVMVNRDYKSVAGEVHWLMKSASVDRAAALCAATFPTIPTAMFKDLVEAIAHSDAFGKRIALGWRISSRLRELRRVGLVQGEASRLWRTIALFFERLRRRKGLTLQTGGMIVAFVGPKATGKSTLVGELKRRFGRHLNVRAIHAGKPPPTALTFLPRLFIPLARRLFSRERAGEYQKLQRRNEGRYSLLYVLRMVMLAYDRRALLRSAFRAASGGSIVLSDRYPSETIGAIDSPCFTDAAIARCKSPIKCWLMRKERAIFASLPKPSLAVRLVAPIEMTIARDASRVKPGGPDAEAIQNRWDLETQAEFSGVPTVLIDTSNSLEETVRATANAVWAAL